MNNDNVFIEYPGLTMKTIYEKFEICCDCIHCSLCDLLLKHIICDSKSAPGRFKQIAENVWVCPVKIQKR